MKSGYVIIPNEDPAYFNENVQKCVATLGVYKKCPVCGKIFYILPGGESKWVYRVKGRSHHGLGRQVCSYACMRKGVKR